MASTEGPAQTIALIHNTALPRPLNVLSTAIAEFAKRDYFASRVPNYDIHIIDLASYNLSQADSSLSPEANETTTPLKSPSDWEVDISKHSAFILLFPYHTWSHCTSLKHALSTLPPHLIHKPTLLLGFGKEEPYHPNEYERTWKKKSFDMMRDFLLERGVKVVDMEKDEFGGWPKGGWPEFMVYADYWEDWITGGYNAFIGGQQAEAWENRAENRCARGINMLVAGIEKGRK
ncbi:hypothetical protein DL98DRAFT_210376 [Cadophora sp. DSE1049]|nr:hypothetical protein DL98DRAFT_210376 [Cadophora sp. DSE1049]